MHIIKIKWEMHILTVSFFMFGDKAVLKHFNDDDNNYRRKLKNYYNYTCQVVCIFVYHFLVGEKVSNSKISKRQTQTASRRSGIILVQR